LAVESVSTGLQQLLCGCFVKEGGTDSDGTGEDTQDTKERRRTTGGVPNFSLANALPALLHHLMFLLFIALLLLLQDRDNDGDVDFNDVLTLKEDGGLANGESISKETVTVFDIDFAT
jgi:hypothetical protein